MGASNYEHGWELCTQGRLGLLGEAETVFMIVKREYHVRVLLGEGIRIVKNLYVHRKECSGEMYVPVRDEEVRWAKMEV